MTALLAAANFYVAGLDLWRTPHASESIVNPRDIRAMPEYVADRAVADPRPLTVLISNSQGAYDGIDAAAVYPALLRERLKATRLENWSVDGLRSVELELLTRQALRRGAQTVVIVVGALSIDPQQVATIDYGHTDTDVLLAEPSLWRTLAGGVTFAHIDRDQFAARLLRANVPLVRARTAFRDMLAERLPQRLHEPLFGHRLTPLIAGPKVAASKARWGRDMSKEPTPHINDKKLRPALETLELLASSLARESSGTRIIWCWQPVAYGRLDPRTRGEGARLYELAAPILTAHGFEVHDFSTAIADDYFFDVTHFLPRGHAAMADLMRELDAFR